MSVMREITIPTDRPRIALIRLGAMGDCLYTLPLVSALKTRFPRAEVVWIVGAEHQEIPRLHPGLDEVIVVDSKRWRRRSRCWHRHPGWRDEAY